MEKAIGIQGLAGDRQPPVIISTTVTEMLQDAEMRDLVDPWFAAQPMP